MKINENKIWTGKYKRIPFKINNFFLEGLSKEQWTFYLIIRFAQMPKNTHERFWLKPTHNRLFKRTIYRYEEEPLIADIEWHCGCTYYEKRGGFDGLDRVVKIGCDYSHLYDEEHTYNFDMILNDVKNAIDSLHGMISNIKYWCQYCGKWGLRGYKKVNEDIYYCPKCFKEHKNEKM